jgi:hypothetical protein
MNVFGGLGGIVFDPKTSRLSSRSILSPLKPRSERFLIGGNISLFIVSLARCFRGSQLFGYFLYSSEGIYLFDALFAPGLREAAKLLERDSVLGFRRHLENRFARWVAKKESDGVDAKRVKTEIQFRGDTWDRRKPFFSYLFRF